MPRMLRKRPAPAVMTAVATRSAPLETAAATTTTSLPPVGSGLLFQAALAIGLHSIELWVHEHQAMLRAGSLGAVPAEVTAPASTPSEKKHKQHRWTMAERRATSRRFKAYWAAQRALKVKAKSKTKGRLLSMRKAA